MKQIELEQGGGIVLVDDEDFSFLARYKWRNRNGYAIRSGYKEGRSTVSMHREIILPAPGLEVDHCDGNRLNNQRKNLRAVSHAENCKNVGVKPANTNGANGVFWRSEFYKWEAIIRVGGKNIRLGRFRHLVHAILARKLAEARYGFFDRNFA